ncbi:MAG: phosphoribosylanthranilate isomerase [Pseudomonadota bacterium]
MSVRWVKICGMTTADGVAAAITAGADAIGFVFAPSVREVSIVRAIELAEPARNRLAIVAVMRHPDPDVAAAVLEQLQPDYLQTDAVDYASLTLPPGTAALPVYRDSSPPDAAALPEMFLYESDASGSGQTANWQQAADLAARGSLVLAGGLDRANVAEAIAAVAPAGVDVSSGVEDRPGHKDPSLIHEFVAAARRTTGDASVSRQH